MKLYYSPTSPYVRKVVACAIIRGLDGRIDKHTTNPHASPADLVADNPLSKVPCLITDDGLSLFGSQLICEYLDSLGEELPLFPGPRRAAVAGAEIPVAGRRNSRCGRAVSRRAGQAPGSRSGCSDRPLQGRHQPGGRHPGSRSAAQAHRYRFHHGCLRARLPGFPFRRRCMARSDIPN